MKKAILTAFAALLLFTASVQFPAPPEQTIFGIDIDNPGGKAQTRTTTLSLGFNF